MEDLHRREVSKRFWEEEQERIDLGTCCLCPAAFGKYGLHTNCHSGMIMFWDAVQLRPRMYGLPETHEKDVPLRPILSITGSAQRQRLQNISFLEPALTLCSSNCMRDSYTFADIIKTANLDSISVFLFSFDISS